MVGFPRMVIKILCTLPYKHMRRLIRGAGAKDFRARRKHERTVLRCEKFPRIPPSSNSK